MTDEVEEAYDDYVASKAYDPQVDAFSPENIGTVQFIVLARIYDVLMAQLQTQNAAVHKDLLEAHAQGLLLGPSPVFEGLFMTDEMNRVP